LEAVIKVGGSLSRIPRILNALGAELSGLAKKHQFMVVPGGGKFADAVRELDAKYSLPATVSHKMAILAMDQYGLLLSRVIPESSTCDSLETARKISGAGLVPIFLPSQLLFNSDPFEPSWDVTSDSIAAYLAVELKATKAIFVTDVDGIYTKEPKKYLDAELIPEVSVEKLLQFPERTSVDEFLPKLLSKSTLNCYVVNGAKPQRVAAILSGQKTKATQILPNVSQ
jgi:5-(aminomethyl)-3-furanmethanol phosphate kinase